MSKRGLPTNVKMRHDSHYVEELTRANRSIGRIIPINQIEPNPEQPRVEIGDLTELTSSIKQKGVLEPLLVKPVRDTGTFMIIAGERRWRAANLAGLREVPCIELDIDEKTIAEIALIENLQRKDLTIWEEADGLASLSERFGYTHEEIARRIGKSRASVTESMTISKLPEDIREKCVRANINAKSTLLEVARQFDDRAMHKFLETITAQNLSRHEIRQKARPARIKAPSEDNVENSIFKKVPPREAFHYSSPGGEFDVRIHFKQNPEFEKKDVLKALKEAFDEVKKNGLP